MTIGEFLIAAPLGRYLRQHPNTDVRMELGNTADLLQRLRDGSLHFALVEGYYDPSEFESIPYRVERFIPVCAANHQFETPPTRLRQLLGERILVREPGSGTRDLLEKHLAADNLTLADFANVIQIGGMHAILQLLEVDTGISFLYRPAAEEGLRNGRLKALELRDFQVEHELSFLWERGSIFDKDYRALCAQLQQTSG